MNKIIRFAALGLCAVALLGSCKKKGTEPTNGTDITGGNTTGGNNTGGTTPVDNTKGIKLVLAEGETAITIARLQGETISLEGTTTDGAIEAFSAAAPTDAKVVTAAQSGGTIVLKGNVSNLYIYKGNVKLLDLSQAPVTLTSLTSTGATLAGVDLSGAVNLTSLTLRDYASLQTLDLSKLTKLATVKLGRYADSGKQRTLSSVVWPAENVIKTLELLEVGLKTLPFEGFTSLESFELKGSAYGAFDQNFSLNNSKLKTFTLFKAKHTKSLILENNTQLTSVAYTGRRKDLAGATEVVVKGSPLLTTVDLRTDDVSPGITKIDLSNNAKLATLTIDKMSLFQSAGLRTVDLSGTALSAESILAVIAHLPQGDGSSYRIKLTNPASNVSAAVAAKQWVLQ